MPNLVYKAPLTPHSFWKLYIYLHVLIYGPKGNRICLTSVETNFVTKVPSYVHSQYIARPFVHFTGRQARSSIFRSLPLLLLEWSCIKLNVILLQFISLQSAAPLSSFCWSTEGHSNIGGHVVQAHYRIERKNVVKAIFNSSGRHHYSKRKYNNMEVCTVAIVPYTTHIH